MSAVAGLAGLGPGELYSLACGLCWAVAVILFKRAGEQLPPFALGLTKNSLALGLLLPTAWLFSGPLPALPASSLGLAALSGLLGIALGDTLYFRALNRIGAARIAAAQTLYSPFVIVLSLAFLGERLLPVQWWGVVAVLAGIALVTWEPAQASVSRRALLGGVLLAITSVLAMALGVVIAKPLLERHDFLWIVCLRVAAGVLGMSLWLLHGETRQRLQQALRAVHDWRPILLGGFLGTYVSMLLWLAGYKYTQASIAAVLNELAAVFIVLLAAVWLRERVSRRQLAGIALALLGVLRVLIV
ncbi:MAG TPA: DMT family transporter [Nevskiaceae bacterium]|nr:DMT family transporter [Nevskiaceae bacterium]